jgi:putative transcriptional regulator
MNDDLFKQLIDSVNQADIIIQGKAKASRVTEFAEPQVKAAHVKTGLTQILFADVLDVSKRTLNNWEQGRRHTAGPAKALLKILDTEPNQVLQTLNNYMFIKLNGQKE